MASSASNFASSDMRVASPENTFRADAPPPRHESPVSTMSNSTRPRSQQKPVDEAVSTALDKAQSETSSQISPELIAQITQNVIKQLQQTGIETSPSAPPPPPSQPILHQPVPQSPATTASGTSPKNAPDRVYTPPSPHKHSDDVVPRSDGGRSPVKGTSASDHGIKREPSPFSQSSDTSEVPYTRPKGPSRLCSAKEQTTLERIWGQLFDEEGNSTPRLGQLLRGLAVHLVCGPQDSLMDSRLPLRMC